MKSNREAEEHFSEQMYDFTFPVYVSKTDKYLYRDQPFVTVVTAPRVMLLVYDGPQVLFKMFSHNTYLQIYIYLPQSAKKVQRNSTIYVTKE